MKLSFVLCAAVSGSLFTAAAAEFQAGGHTFTLPEGFTIELAANSPLVDRPIEADFDEKGRLYVTDSSGSNDKIEKQLVEKPHRVVRLEDTDGDGIFDKTVVFADKLSFPEGAMWKDGSLYVSVPPSIWKLTDTDDDGVADKREEWFKGGTVTGCANDLHGPYAGPDGWIYWCKGAFAKQTHERPGLPPIVTRASHIFRARPDGSGLETVMTGGMDNPVGIAFSAEGERFFTCTFIQHPEGGRRDALVHAIYGGVYGKVNDVVDDHPQTGDLMPVMTHLGAAAPCGVIRYESGVMGDGYKNNFLVCNFNMHKITRHIPTSDGATFKTENSDFLVAADTDFHPTDILEDADGSLLVVDTGGWYKLCCPTSQLAKPDVLGAIYRIRKAGSKKFEDPRGSKIDFKQASHPGLIQLLSDERPFVRQRAVAEMASRNLEASAAALTIHDDPDAQILATWALSRANPKNPQEFLNLLTVEDARVRMVAAQALSARNDVVDHGSDMAGDYVARRILEDLAAMLNASNPAEKRVAAEALGRAGSKAGSASSARKITQALLKAASQKLDRTLEHSITFALIETAKPEFIRPALADKNGEVQKIALTALSQIPKALTAMDVSPFLTGDSELRKTAEWIAAKHPEWGADLAAHLGRDLRNRTDLKSLIPLLARLAVSVEIQQLIADMAGYNPTVALHAMAQSGLKKTTSIWIAPVARLLRSENPEIQRDAIAATLGPWVPKEAAELREALQEVAQNKNAPVGARLAALRALPAGKSLGDDAFSLALQSLDSSTPVETRGDAVVVLNRAALTSDQALQLADRLEKVGPIEFTRLFEVFEKRTNEITGLRIVGALQKSSVLASLPPDWIAQRLAKFPESVRKAAASLPHSAAGDVASQRAHLEELASGFTGGDIRHGQALFNSAKTACVSCHSIGYLGGKVGPDLTSIGQVRTAIDILESIVYPSASFVRSYEPVLVQTKDGEAHTGILRGDSDEWVLLVTGPNAEERISRDKIAEMRPGAVSIMPAGLESQLSKQDLADLVAFLKGTKWGAN